MNPKQIFVFWMGGIFYCILHFGAILHAWWWWGGQSLGIHLCACSSAEDQEQLFPQVASLCTDGVRETGDSSVLPPTGVTTNNLKASVHLFFYFDACRHLFSRSKSTYANICQEQEGKANWSGRLKWTSVFNRIFFCASGTRFIIMITNHKGHLSAFLN